MRPTTIEDLTVLTKRISDLESWINYNKETLTLYEMLGKTESYNSLKEYIQLSQSYCDSLNQSLKLLKEQFIVQELAQ